MSLTAVADPVPLVFSEDGNAARVAGTGLTLDTIVEAFRRGATPEEIAQDYPSVALSDVYSVIAYYLRHRPEVEEYLSGRGRAHRELRSEIESRPVYAEPRERLLGRIRRPRATAS